MSGQLNRCELAPLRLQEPRVKMLPHNYAPTPMTRTSVHRPLHDCPWLSCTPTFMHELPNIRIVTVMVTVHPPAASPPVSRNTSLRVPSRARTTSVSSSPPSQLTAGLQREQTIVPHVWHTIHWLYVFNCKVVCRPVGCPAGMFSGSPGARFSNQELFCTIYECIVFTISLSVSCNSFPTDLPCRVQELGRQPALHPERLLQALNPAPVRIQPAPDLNAQIQQWPGSE